MITIYLVRLPSVVGAADRNDGTYRLDLTDGTSRLATDAEILAATQAATIAANQSECTSRILAVWPTEKQCSANAGVYPQADHDAMTAWIAAHISAENAAADLITAATSVEEVETVKTPLWPA